MKPYDLFAVETWHSRHITTVAARSPEEAKRKAWKAIFKRSPKLVPYFRENGFLVKSVSSRTQGMQSKLAVRKDGIMESALCCPSDLRAGRG